MPDDLNRNVTLPITCPKCANQTQETIARLEQDPDLTCSGCGSTIYIKAEDLRRGLQKVQKAIDEFRRHVGRRR